MLISSFDLEDPSVSNSSLISSPLWFICKEEGVNNICYHGHLPSLRTADAFPVVASLPPKNIFRRERSDDRKCVCCSQAITYLALGFSTVNYKKGKYIRPQIEVFTYNFPFTDYNTPCLLEKNCTCSFLSHSINLKKFLLLRIFVYVLFWRNWPWVFDQWKDYLRLGWGLLRCLTWVTNPCRSTLQCYWEESVRNVTLSTVYLYTCAGWFKLKGRHCLHWFL